jgi:hypothetical protein
MRPVDPWSVELVGSSSDAAALAAYRRLQEKYPSILGGREPRVFHHGLARGSMGWARIHVGAENRTTAEKLCANLRAAGASYCAVEFVWTTKDQEWLLWSDIPYYCGDSSKALSSLAEDVTMLDQCHR